MPGTRPARAPDRAPLIDASRAHPALGLAFGIVLIVAAMPRACARYVGPAGASAGPLAPAALDKGHGTSRIGPRPVRGDRD